MAFSGIEANMARIRFSVAHPHSPTSASLGSRTHGGKLPPLFIRAARYTGPVPAGMIDIVSPDRYLHLWGRTLVESAQDRAIGAIDPREQAPKLLPGNLAPATAQAVVRAESLPTGLALLLVSPEFLRR
jgi:hypothetical protein